MNFGNLKNCEGCKQRKEAIQKMLTDHKFWLGIVVGAGGFYLYKRMKG